MKRLLVGLALLALDYGVAAAEPVRVQGVRSWSGPDHTRVVFDLTSPVEHRLFTLDDPARVVVDIDGTRLGEGEASGLSDSEVLENVRTGRRSDGALRVVFDLAREVNPKSFVVPPNEEYGHRLVVDLEKPRDRQEPVKTVPEGRDELVVAIDAGHGGEDPGAIGPRGTHEKDIVMATARKLKTLIDKQARMRAELIRDGDYYIGLRERTRKAHKLGADMFVSLHADAFRDHRVRGSSVFVLSQSGASSEMAELLAESENESDRIAGVSFADREADVRSVLVDLSRRATIEASAGLARSLLGELADAGRVHSDHVERAGFAVLKSLDMPSVLVELAFISNPVEEQRLRTADYQWQLARAVREGLVDYADDRMGTLRIASGEAYRDYTVERGDTLSGIARRHRVSVARLRELNDLRGNTIQIGRKLRIP